MDKAVEAAARELRPAIAAAADRAVEQTIGLDVTDSIYIAGKVTDEVAKVVVNQANAEPWYQSRVTWGVIIAGVFTIAKPFLGDLHLSTEQAADIANALATAGQAIGFGLTLYGRWLAKKPLGA